MRPGAGLLPVVLGLVGVGLLGVGAGFLTPRGGPGAAHAAARGRPPGVAPAVTGPTLVSPPMRVHFLDVGQGAATLIELPCGAMLVDTGGELDDAFDSNVALTAYLDAFFARRADLNRTLDVLLLTHPHIDHVRGVPSVLDAYTVRNVVDDGFPATQEDAVASMRRLGEFVTAHPEVNHLSVSTSDFPSDGSAFTSPILDPFPSCKGVDPQVRALWGGVPSDPGWGEDDYGKERFQNANNHSVATRIDFGQSSLLITGDLETPSIAGMIAARTPDLLDVDVYEVGHHGSANGTTADLMRLMTPDWAVMEVGPWDRKASWTAWAYGHPRQPTIDLLEQGVLGSRAAVAEEIGTAMKTFLSEDIDKAIYATGWDGTVVLDAGADGTITRGKRDLGG